MSTAIYYFTGTGNSLVVARDLAEKLHGELIPICSVIHQEQIEITADAVGIVFPVYHQGIPNIVRRFVSQLCNLEGKYIFGVCTYGGSPGIAIKYLKEIIATSGGTLAAGFGVTMPYNYITPSPVVKNFFKSFVLREITLDRQQKMFANWKVELESIHEYIHARKAGRFDTKAVIIESIVDYFNLRNTLQKNVWLKIAGYSGHTDMSFAESISFMDCGFTCDSRCNSCTICARICPVGNILMTDGQPVWQHRCEQCFACLQWCPKEAIQFGSGTVHGKRYTNPDVKLSEMMVNQRT